MRLKVRRMEEEWRKRKTLFSSHLLPSSNNSHSRQCNKKPTHHEQRQRFPCFLIWSLSRRQHPSPPRSADDSYRTPPPRTSSTRAHPYADRRNSTKTPPRLTHNYLHDVVPAQLWAIQPDEGSIGTVAIRNPKPFLCTFNPRKHTLLPKPSADYV